MVDSLSSTSPCAYIPCTWPSDWVFLYCIYNNLLTFFVFSFAFELVEQTPTWLLRFHIVGPRLYPLALWQPSRTWFWIVSYASEMNVAPQGLEPSKQFWSSLSEHIAIQDIGYHIPNLDISRGDCVWIGGSGWIRTNISQLLQTHRERPQGIFLFPGYWPIASKRLGKVLCEKTKTYGDAKMFSDLP